ncbi:uncharacterized protein LOC113578081 isoform X3 [Electrophorus electricus]|uniref:uncharacterized protein LOC113578081 isoform X3 n=1 Tax=Electrophorus electricus TaxID=8005 RepID=UPI0015CFDDFF|nr:uncharacterized protein LOC113578081 isoform X3 [Electrophorus electricus]
MNRPTRMQRERDSGRWFRWDETPGVSTQFEFVTSQLHQARDSKSPGAVGARVSRRSRKKQDPGYFDNDVPDLLDQLFPQHSGTSCGLLLLHCWNPSWALFLVLKMLPSLT